ncbi:3233_t:CDS:2 [Rhizophagus irregularis]|nr:3233_t:CDS:2 [Rhizophagus irregularis]
MGHFYLGKDIRKLIIQKTLLGRHSISQISKECHVSKTFVKDVRRYYKKHGVLENSNKKKARRKSKLQQERIMVKLLLKKSDWYLDELAAKVTKYQQKYLNDKPNNLSVSVSTVCLMDNCSIHKSLRTYEILAAYGVKLIFLPAYSPGLNSIEQCFSYVKGFLHRYHEWVEREYDAYYVLNTAFNLIESVKLKHVLLMRVMHNLLFDSLIYLTNYQNG